MSRLFYFGTSVLWASINSLMRVWVSLTVKWRKALRVGRSVISIGNLQAGGSGKTPLTLEIARRAIAQGFCVVVLMRGYGGLLEKKGAVLPPGAEHPADPRLHGDEAALFRREVPEAWIVLGADRAAMMKRLDDSFLKGKKADVVLLEDGFQKVAFQKDLELLLVTSHTYSSRIFRDFYAWASKASLVIWTKGQTPPSWLLRSGLPFEKLGMSLEPATPEQRTKKYRLVCGVGDPEHVLSSAQAAGFEVVDVVRLRDHADYNPAWVQTWVEASLREGVHILTTSKDVVKWSGVPLTGVDVLQLRVLLPDSLEKLISDQWKRLRHRQPIC